MRLGAEMSEERTPVQIAAVVVGATLLLLGILGFTPGITEHFDDMKFAGDRPSARIFGVFQISGLHNLAHLLTGAVGLALARTPRGARAYLLGGGLFYLAFWLIGFVNDAYWIPSNNADDVLHLVFGGGMIALGIATTRRR
jgi:hypothetical protein